MGSYSDYMDFGRFDDILEKSRTERLNQAMEDLGYGNWPYLPKNEEKLVDKPKPIKKKFRKKIRNKKKQQKI